MRSAEGCHLQDLRLEHIGGAADSKLSIAILPCTMPSSEHGMCVIWTGCCNGLTMT